jgi:hypothetical protein
MQISLRQEAIETIALLWWAVTSLPGVPLELTVKRAPLSVCVQNPPSLSLFTLLHGPRLLELRPKPFGFAAFNF